MNLEIFKPEDFDNEPYRPMTPNTVSRLANMLVNKWIKDKSLVYYGYIGAEGLFFSCDPRPGIKDKSCTHQATIICIEPIEKCEHKVVNRIQIQLDKNYQLGRAIFKCEDCGSELESLGWKEI